MLNLTELPISGAPEQGCRTIPTTFYLLNIYLTELPGNKAETERITLKFQKCRKRIRRPVDLLVICNL